FWICAISELIEFVCICTSDSCARRWSPAGGGCGGQAPPELRRCKDRGGCFCVRRGGLLDTFRGLNRPAPPQIRLTRPIPYQTPRPKPPGRARTAGLGFARGASPGHGRPPGEEPKL